MAPSQGRSDRGHQRNDGDRDLEDYDDSDDDDTYGTCQLLLGWFLSVVALLSAVLMFSSAITHHWLVINGNSETNTTIAFGVIRVCHDSSCEPIRYVPPRGCDRTAGEINERNGATEGFIVLALVMEVLCAMLGVFATLRILQHDRIRAIMRGDLRGPPPTAIALAKLKLAEEVLRKRIIGIFLTALIAVVSDAIGIGLYFSSINGYVYCESVCDYYQRTTGTTDCKLGLTASLAFGGIAGAALVWIFSVIVMCIYLSKYDRLFDGIQPVDDIDGIAVQASEPTSSRPSQSAQRSKQQKQSGSRSEPEHTRASSSAATNGHTAESKKKVKIDSDDSDRERNGSRDFMANSTNTNVYSSRGTPSERQAQQQSSTTTAKDSRRSQEPSQQATQQSSPKQQQQQGRSDPPPQQQMAPTQAKKVDPLARQQPEEKYVSPQRRRSPPPERASSSRQQLSNPLDMDTMVSAPPRNVLPEHRELISNLKGNDWDYVESSGLYWSAEEKLYFDPNSTHFFDPESDMWYDPELDDWYTLEEEPED